jgi:uncharacterized membrane protein
MTELEASFFIKSNAVFGFLFFAGLVATIFVMVRREIEDLFLKWALYFMLLAQAITICVCFTVFSYSVEQYCTEQTVPF